MPRPPRRLDPASVAELLRDVWPDLPLRELSMEKVHTGRNSDHFRVHHRDRSMIIRSAPQGDGAARYIAALEALRDEPFAPKLYGHAEVIGRRHLVAMEDAGARTFTAPEIEQQLPELVEITRSVHESEAFRDVVGEAGLDERASEEPPDWLVTSLEQLREAAADDERVANLERWLDASQTQDSQLDLTNSVLVHGHGDLHRANWMATPGGPMLIDWEDMGRGPLANELASLIVFGHLPPRSVAELYGVSEEYVEVIEKTAARTALFLYAYWLQKLLEEDDAVPPVDDYDLAYAEAMSERYFG